MTHPTNGKPSIAIIGSGVAGLGCAYLLNNAYNVTVFESADYAGGHSNTVTATHPSGQQLPIDTGFMVYNPETYPNLIQLFEKLGIAGVETDMSFSVQHRPEQLEWSGGGWQELFAQPANVFNGRFWQLLMALKRFNADAETALKNGTANNLTVGQYCQQQGYPDVTLDWFLLPMSAAIWSTHPERMRDFPARTLLRFFVNHRFVGMGNHIQWLTVPGGSQTYVTKILDALSKAGGQLHLNTPVTAVTRQANCATITLASGESHTFDKVILATHADITCKLLNNPTQLENNLLSTFEYEPNIATLHTDSSVLPQRPKAWAAWNYRLDNINSQPQASTHYWMNRLQHLPDENDKAAGTQYIVSINGEELVKPECIEQTIHYTHPRFTMASIGAQKRLPELNKQNDQTLFYAGSYFRYGFHEDAFGSAVQLCRHLLGADIWPNADWAA